MTLRPEEIDKISADPGNKAVKIEGLSQKYADILLFLKKSLDEPKDKEDVFDVSIDAINRMGFEFSFIAIFREDKKYSSAVRIRVDSELVNRVEDYARKMMPGMTALRYRIPIYEDGRIYRKFLIEGRKPLVSNNIKVSDPASVISADMGELYDNLISKDSPLTLLLPAFKRIAPYRHAISTQLFIDGEAFGNIGIASGKELSEEELDVLLVMSRMMSKALERVGFAKNYL
jgi:hypothetical protein